jgi:hypothetical protein
MLAGLVLMGGCGEQRNTFRLLVPAHDFDGEIAAELAEVFEQNSHHRLELVPVPDSFETALDALEEEYADLALTSNAQPFREGITTVMPLYPTVLHILYRRGPRRLLTGIIGTLDIEPSDVKFLDKFDELDELPDVNVVYVPISPERIRGLLQREGVAGEYSFLSFGAAEDVGTGGEIDRAVLLNPRLSPFIIPVGTYGDQAWIAPWFMT